MEWVSSRCAIIAAPIVSPGDAVNSRPSKLNLSIAAPSKSGCAIKLRVLRVAYPAGSKSKAEIEIGDKRLHLRLDRRRQRQARRQRRSCREAHMREERFRRRDISLPADRLDERQPFHVQRMSFRDPALVDDKFKQTREGRRRDVRGDSHPSLRALNEGLKA